MKNKPFEEIKINGLTLKNRFIMSAAADNLSYYPEKQIQRFSELAKGDVSLIISGGLKLNRIDSWDKIVDATHKNGAKLAIQIVTKPGPGKTPWSSSDSAPLAVSKISKENPFFNSLIHYCAHREATEEDIAEIINSYGKAAAKIKAIGADAIQIHAAHQSFLSQFLSPITNKRTDRWGGSIENRTRIHREIYKTIRSKVGKEFPIIIKLGVEDALKSGLKFSDGKEAAKIISICGYDAIEISQGLQDIEEAFTHSNWEGTPTRTGIKNEGYFIDWCKKIKKEIPTPLIVSGGIRSYELVEKILKKEKADIIGLCRSLIREPDLINRWQSGDHKKATCIACNKCITELLLKCLPLECYLLKY